LKEAEQRRKDHWEQGPPMGFINEDLTYEEKRNFRYSPYASTIAITRNLHIIIKNKGGVLPS